VNDVPLRISHVEEATEQRKHRPKDVLRYKVFIHSLYILHTKRCKVVSLHIINIHVIPNLKCKRDLLLYSLILFFHSSFLHTQALCFLIFSVNRTIRYNTLQDFFFCLLITSTSTLQVLLLHTTVVR